MALDTNIQEAFDFSLFGGLDKNGNIKKLEGKEAITNALKSWLLSKRGDYIRRPNEGGFLYNWLCKPMSDYNTKRILSSLQIGITYTFAPRIIIETLEVIPNYGRKIYTINLTGIVVNYGVKINFSQDFKTLV